MGRNRSALLVPALTKGSAKFDHTFTKYEFLLEISVKNGFSFAFQFFLLISDGLGVVM